MVAALMLSVAALPISIKVCNATIVIITWFFERQWPNKLSVIKHSLLFRVMMALVFFQVVSLAFCDNLPMGLFPREKKFFYLLIPATIGTTSLNSFQKIS